MPTSKAIGLTGQALAETADLAGLIPLMGTAVEYAINKIPLVRRTRAEAMFGQLSKLIDLEPERLLEALRQNDAFTELVTAAAEAAAASRLADKITLLAQVAADAWQNSKELTSMTSVLDAAHLRIATLRDIEAVHVRVLRDIEMRDGGSTRADSLRTAFRETIVLDAVLATLVRYGLLFVSDALVGFGSPMYQVTDYGRFVLDSFRQTPTK